MPLGLCAGHVPLQGIASAIAMALCGMHMLRACLSLALMPLCSTVLVVAECGDGMSFSWIWRV